MRHWPVVIECLTMKSECPPDISMTYQTSVRLSKTSSAPGTQGCSHWGVNDKYCAWKSGSTFRITPGLFLKDVKKIRSVSNAQSLCRYILLRKVYAFTRSKIAIMNQRMKVVSSILPRSIRLHYHTSATCWFGMMLYSLVFYLKRKGFM